MDQENKNGGLISPPLEEQATKEGEVVTIPLVDFGVWRQTVADEIRSYAEHRVGEMEALARNPDPEIQAAQFVQGSDIVGTALLFSGILTFVRAGAPTKVILERIAGLLREYRKQELETQIEEKRKADLGRIILTG